MPTDFKLSCGAQVLRERGVAFRVRAPRVRRMDVKLVQSQAIVPMRRDDDDTFEAVVPQARVGDDYFYVLDGERERPDPVSRHQPHGVHGPSRIVDPGAFPWSDGAWRGLALQGCVFYELHVGTFTSAGTFDAVIAKLPYLRDLGVTAVECMPVAQFPGGRNWGYDGVHLYAPQSTYGGPDGLKRLIDACHREGICFVLDVVYNHFGPEGNYLSEFTPCFSSRYRTPWGDAINFDAAGSDGVRRYFIENALYWLTEYHVDALRLDAIHGIFDFSARHILEEMHAEFKEEARRLGRRAYLIAESDLNDVRVIKPVEMGGYGLDAQWSDDFQHAVHAFIADDRAGYFVDFGRLSDVKKAFEEGFVYDGCRSAYRRRRHGSSSMSRPGSQLVVCLQNHDQVANGSRGERHGTLLSLEQQKVAAALLILAPNLLLIFMGQEWGEKAPFDYFVSHSDDALAEAVRRGRREEFEAFEHKREFADPQSEATFTACRLRWGENDKAGHAELLAYYRELLRLRRENACLSNCRKDLTWVHLDEERRFMTIERGDPFGGHALGVFNMAPIAAFVPCPASQDRWVLALESSEARFGGGKPAPSRIEKPNEGQRGVDLGPWSAAIYIRG